MTGSPAPWQNVAARLRPFIARRVAPAEIDDVMQDVFVRMQRGLPQLRDEERFTPWLFQIARNSIAEHMRTRARHPIVGGDAEQEPTAETEEDDQLLHSEDLEDSGSFLLDVREPLEVAAAQIPGAVNISLNELRQRLSELPKDRRICAYCLVGQRSYYAARPLTLHGFNACNLSGGLKSFTLKTKPT